MARGTMSRVYNPSQSANPFQPENTSILERHTMTREADLALLAAGSYWDIRKGDIFVGNWGQSKIITM